MVLRTFEFQLLIAGTDRGQKLALQSENVFIKKSSPIDLGSYFWSILGIVTQFHKFFQFHLF